EYYLPLFFETTATLADYLPRDATVALQGDVPRAVERFWQDTESRYRLLRGDKSRPLLPPTDVFLPLDVFNGALKGFGRIEFPATIADFSAAAPPAESTSETGAEEGRRERTKTVTLPPIRVDRRAEDPLATLKRFLDAESGRVLICAESPGRRETMQQYFA